MDKTERTILLEPRNKLLWRFMSFLFILNGIFHVLSKSAEWYRLFLGIAMIIGGVFYGFYSVVGFLEDSKYAPKLRVNTQLIELKSSIWKKTHLIKWADVKLIHFASYKVEFELTNGAKAFAYNTKYEKSKQLKQIIREFAEPQNIQVIGG
jgi:hypothetical protein